jgi:hypothetical protein
MNVRPPDVFVKLHLHAKFQAAFGDPVCQLLQVNLVPGRRDQNRFGPLLEVIFRNNLFGELPITLVGDYKLYFIGI